MRLFSLPYLCVWLALLLVAPICPRATASTDTVPASVAEHNATSSGATTPGDASAAHTIHVLSQRQHFSPDVGQYQFVGEVSIEVSTTQITANEVIYDAPQERLEAAGSVVLTRGGTQYQGERLEYTLKNGSWRFLDWKTTLPAPALDARLTGSLYLHGHDAQDISAGYRMMQSHLTTCDAEKPHYELVAKQVDIYPGKRLIAHDVDLYILGKRVLHLAWFFLPLNGERPTVLPEAGYNNVEGWFLRIPYQYVLGEHQMGMLRLDLTEKRGIGLGLMHEYDVPGGQGSARLYDSLGSGDYSVLFTHDQHLPLDTTLKLTLEQQRDSVYHDTPLTTNMARAELLRTTTHTATDLTYSTQQLDATTDSTSVLLHHQITQPNDVIQFDSGFYLNTYLTQATQQLQNHLQWTHKFGVGDTQVRLDDQAFTTSTGAQILSYSMPQRLPELTFTTDSNRLHLPVLNALPLTATFGWGLYREQANAPALGRSLMDLRLTPFVRTLGATQITMQGELRQTVYGDPSVSAQYLARTDLTAVSKLGKTTNTFQYDRQLNDGYTPLVMDATYPSHRLSDVLQYQTTGFQASLSGGRDLQLNSWNDLNLLLAAQPAKALTLSSQVEYDPNAHQFRDLVSQLAWDDHHALAASLQTRYALDAHSLLTADLALDWKPGPWRVQWQVGLWGGTSTLYMNRWQVTRDLHCWVAGVYADPISQSYGFIFQPKVFGDLTLPSLLLGGSQTGINSGVNWAF